MTESLTSSKEGRPREVYFSISNILNAVQVRMEDGSVVSHHIAIQHREHEGKPKFQALGGGAKLTPEAKAQLKDEFEDIRFRSGEESTDARFYLPVPEGLSKEEEAKWASGVMERFSQQDSAIFEDDILREVVHELTDESGILSPEDVTDIHGTHVSVVSPIQWDKQTSGRSAHADGYHRIFHLFNIEISEEVFNKLAESEKIKVLSDEEKKVIIKATEEGESVAELPDGSVVVENVLLNPYEPH
ncbi:hypothetical protein COU15_01405 [Candidatus Kaiserbacteria bacterium CG10_big_fil_rev_8_21_14_0_10_45_20]|uniref:Uncharacterized protein n=1 Tax=Candidatus Kaiserbacteria bacterium CG10_big_fil_rev_8_21_14_0_10_45_20 TaxID=1974607 RepID=A0A2H0UFV9_9BACT|nr:MAG: hypothetical protein COU15_01405 [Candidatus Kaiserbacteria bacterium CG10_big_fil_rev_8_21_14_0_10_45_20]